MSPVSKSAVPITWGTKLSDSIEYRYNSEGHTSNYSSVEDSDGFTKHYVSSFSMNDDFSKRSYVDPWDMENYSFLRKQLEDISITCNRNFPSFKCSQNNFYYVPLDNNGSPQYQYKQYVDTAECNGGFTPHPYKDDAHGLMSNIDEYDFYNEHFDTNAQILQNEGASFMEFNNPSRQSERSRFNSQDYDTYTPPSIIKEIPNLYAPNQICKLRRRASAVTFRPDTYTEDLIDNDILPNTSKNKLKNSDTCQTKKKSLSDIKIKLNRRKSFHDVSDNFELTLGQAEKRETNLNLNANKWRKLHMEIIPEFQVNDSSEKKKSKISIKLPRKILKESTLQIPEAQIGLNISFNNKSNLEKKPLKANWNSEPTNPLVCMYETAKRKRKIFLPNTWKILNEDNEIRSNQLEMQDVFSLDPIEQYLNRPAGRYTMTNYGHLKIDYSCSWNYLDQCITKRLCL